MATYSNVIDEINEFLLGVNRLQPISKKSFRGVFVKKLSNSNLVADKKYRYLNTGKKTNQTHLDLTGQETLRFFFGSDFVAKKEYIEIKIDIPVEHLGFLGKIDCPEEHILKKGKYKEDAIVLKRKSVEGVNFVPKSNRLYSAYAYKKYEGHLGEQSQINRLNNRDEYYDLCASAYEGDYIIFLQYDYEHYLCLLLPSEYSHSLARKLGRGTNFPFWNVAYDEK